MERVLLATRVDGKLLPPEKTLLKARGDFEAVRLKSKDSGNSGRASIAFEENGMDPGLKAAWTIRTCIILTSLGYAGVQTTDATLQDSATKGALTWLRKNLGDYRFERVDREYLEDCFAYEFVHASDPRKRIVAVWKPSGEPHITRLYNDPFKIVRAEQMPAGAASAESVEVKQEIEGYMALQVGEAPILIWLEE